MSDDRSRRNDRGGGRQAPTGRRRPAGIERAERTPGAPPRAPGGQARTAGRPPAPADLDHVDPDLPRGVVRELERNTRSREDADAAARALTAASYALEDGDGAAAIPYLEWAKAVAPRAPSVREALGVARYLVEEWSAAVSELQAYRRLTGRHDQDHVVADCFRALGHPAARVAEVVQEMDPDRDGADRYAEGMIVWASALGDAGDPGAGRAVLRRALERLAAGEHADEPPEHLVRLWYVAGDLADRDGDADAAERWFLRVAGVDRDLYDVSERLDRLAR